MRRALATLGLAALLVGVPFVLLGLGAPPRIPSFSAHLTDTYLPLDTVLRVIALVVWVLWLYLLIAAALRAIAVTIWPDDSTSHSALLRTSALLAPGLLRRLVDLAVGGAIIAASVSVRAAVAIPRTPEPAATKVAAPAASGHDARVSTHEHRRRDAYRVHSGDSLWRIAERKLGSGFRWREIFALNKGKHFPDGRRLTNPRLIYPGWNLELPATSRGEETRAQRSEKLSHVQQRAELATSASAPSLPPARVRMEPRQTSPSLTQPSQPDRHAERRVLSRPVLRLPSGMVVAASFASGLLTAELLGRLHRRRRRRFGPQGELDDSVAVSEAPLLNDLRRAGAAPMSGRLDAAIEAVSSAWREAAGTSPRLLLALERKDGVTALIDDPAGARLPERSGGSVSPALRFSREGSLVRAEVRGPFPSRLRRVSTPLECGLVTPLASARDTAALHVGLLGLGGISLSGTHVADLARQVVLATAAPSGVNELEMILLGGDVLGVERLPHVTRVCGWEDSAELLRELQEEFVRRARLFVVEGIEDIWAHLATRPDERIPAVVIIAAEPPSALKPLIEALRSQAPPLGAVLIAVGWRPEGTRLHALVDDSFEIETDLPCPRTLGPLLIAIESVAQAIDVIRDAHAQTTNEPAGNDEAPDLHDSSAMTLSMQHPPGDEIPPAPEASIVASPAHAVEVSAPVESLPTLGTDSRLSLPSAEAPRDCPAVRCLGNMEVSRGGRTLGKGWRKKSKEILAYLVAHPQGVTKERIVEAIWPECDPPEGEAAFLRRVSELRQYVRGHHDSRGYVLREGETYRLEPDTWWIDAVAMERLVDEAARCSDPARAEAMLRDAIALYRGEFCADCYYSWLEPARERYRAHLLRGLALLGDILEERGEHTEALSVVDRAIEIDPLCEDLWRRAMTIEATRGRRAVALRRYRRLEAILEQEIDVDPDPETQALAKQLQASRPEVGATG